MVGGESEQGVLEVRHRKDYDVKQKQDRQLSWIISQALEKSTTGVYTARNLKSSYLVHVASYQRHSLCSVVQ